MLQNATPVSFVTIGTSCCPGVDRCTEMPDGRVFDSVRRTDMTRKKRTESIFAYLNRSAKPGSAASRELVEAWLSLVPAAEYANLRRRFRCGNDAEYISALQELTLHELLRRQGCQVWFHPDIPGTTRQPDFRVLESEGVEFFLEACTSTNISSGPENGPRANRVRDFLQGLSLPGYLIAIDELTEGTSDLSQRVLARHIKDGIRAGVVGYSADSISIPVFTTDDGWRIELTAFPTDRYGTRSGTVMQEAWSRKWTEPSYPLRKSLSRKSGSYVSQLAMPYVIAVNSSDVMRTDRDFEGTLFGEHHDGTAEGSPPSPGFWGTAADPINCRVSAVLFTVNLCEPTLLMGQAYGCLYVNPWAHHTYHGLLTRLPTFRYENGGLKKSRGAPLHKLLKLRRRDTAMWE
jgi:hypothetical protein